MLDTLKKILPSVIKAGEEVLKIYSTNFEVKYKSHEDPLTQADITVHTILEKAISTEFPGSIFLSEEGTGQIPFSESIWILDPIDGTREFVKKNNQFAISLALCNYGRPSLGIILNPSTEELFLGADGLGISYSKMSNPILPDGNFPLKNGSNKRQSAVVSNSEYKENLFWDDYWKEEMDIHPKGSIAYKLGLVAAGIHDVTISLKPKSDWDIAAGVVLIRSAGGISLDLNGNEFNFFQESHKQDGILAGRREFIQNFYRKNSEKIKRDKKSW